MQEADKLAQSARPIEADEKYRAVVARGDGRRVDEQTRETIERAKSAIVELAPAVAEAKRRASGTEAARASESDVVVPSPKPGEPVKQPEAALALVERLKEKGGVTRDEHALHKPITSIHLSSSKATDDDLASLEGLDSLVDLLLWQPQITDAGLRHLTSLKNLRSLSLGFCQITDAGLRHLTGLKNLRHLGLTDCPIKGPGLKHLSGLPVFQSLYLTWTHIDDDALVHLQNFIRLEELFIQGFPIGDAGLEHLRGLTNLRKLSFGSFGEPTLITASGLKKLRGLTRLRYLAVHGEGITDEGLEEIASSHPLLDYLDVRQSSITDEGLKHIPLMTNLEKLLLDENREITDNGLDHLKGLKELRVLVLWRTQVTDSGVQELKESLPTTFISH
jgi:hypothetical protein